MTEPSRTPTLVVVSGPPGAGKTTLAHNLARAIGCPAICRDEIKEGMAHPIPGYQPGPEDTLPLRTLAVFFETIEVLLRAGVTVVAESAFQDQLWRPRLLAFEALAKIRVVHCVVDAESAHRRRRERAITNPLRAIHEGPSPPPTREEVANAHEAFVAVSMDAPELHVDTTRGYEPRLAEIAAWVNAEQ